MSTTHEEPNPFSKWRSLLLNLPAERETLRANSAYKNARQIIAVFFWIAMAPAVLVLIAMVVSIFHPSFWGGLGAWGDRIVVMLSGVLMRLVLLVAIFFYASPFVVAYELAQAFFDIADATLSSSSRPDLEVPK